MRLPWAKTELVLHLLQRLNSLGLLSFLKRQRLRSPEQLVDAVITDISRRLTESRLQMLAADLARKRVSQDSVPDDALAKTRQGLEKLEASLNELIARRDLLILHTRDADARLAIERSLMEVGSEPADVALQMLKDKAADARAEADATAEIRQISEEVRGDL